MRFKAFLSNLGVACAIVVFLAETGRGQLFENLAKLSPTIPVGSGALKEDVEGQEIGERADGPKWVTTGDFDGDGKQDFSTCHNNGELTVVYGRGGRNLWSTGEFREWNSGIAIRYVGRLQRRWDG